MRVLVVEDEEALRAQLVRRLEEAGYAVDQTGDGTEGHFLGAEYPVDVAIVDLGLPGLPGVDIIRRWRESGHAFPVLILTARDRWQDKVQGLEVGADDYLVKPFNMEELLARMRALVRRAAGWTRDRLVCGPISLDTRTHAVVVEARDIELTAYEYKVLEYLMLRAGEVISKSEIGEHVYGEDLDPDSNVLEVLIGRLRRKLDPERAIAPIETLRGRGYRITLPREA